MVSSLVTNNPSSLQIALAVFLRERHLINTFYKYDVTCSYDEALRFRGSAASAASQDVSLRSISNTSEGLIQAVAENFDTNISSPNGLRNTHALALLLVQPNDTDEVMDTTIPRIPQSELKEPVCGDVDVHVYSGPKKPTMPTEATKRSILPLKVLVGQAVSCRRASDLDLGFFKAVIMMCIDPMDPICHPKQSVVNIASGRVGPESVNVWNVVKNGETLKEKYEASFPDGFHNPISSSLVTMNIINRKVKIEERISFDTDLIYNRMMGLRGSREISTKSMFSFELAPVPTSMFDEDGEMKICKNKSSLKKSLKVETPIRAPGLPEVEILDGYAILWHINWPSRTVLHYCKAVSATAQQKLAISDVFLVFDRHYDFSIKSGTRVSRGKKASRRHLLQLSSPLPPKDARS